jgi:hypothetical protein
VARRVAHHVHHRVARILLLIFDGEALGAMLGRLHNDLADLLLLPRARRSSAPDRQTSYNMLEPST